MNDSSPLFQVPLAGYLNEISLTAGDSVQMMLSGEAATASVRVVRLIHGDPNPRGPGYRDEDMAWAARATVELEERVLELGSYVEIPAAEALNPTRGFSLAVWIWPSLISGGWHAIAAKAAAGDFGYALYCAGQNFLTGALSHDGRTVEWCTGAALVEARRWQLVVLTYDSVSGEACLYQAWRGSTPSANRKSFARGPLYPSSAPLLFGASLDLRSTEPRRFGFFEGKLARPQLFDTVLNAAEVERLAQGKLVRPDLILGTWEFSLDVQGQRVVDTSAHRNHGQAVNMPARAVTGPWWEGDADSRYSGSPNEHDAIHFHSDDLDDARWVTTAELSVPRDARSGIHAVIVTTAHDRVFVPFVVKPATATSEVALLVPTLTWQAYGSNRLGYGYTEDGVLDAGVSLYNAHADGSVVYYCTRRRPMRALNPRAGFPNWGSHALTSDLYLVDWLERKGFTYDTLTDEHLHRSGMTLLRPYRCLILSSHPEYWTLPMVLALRSYIEHGGRVLYLGGNGIFWVTSVDSERPYVMEVRKRSSQVDVQPWTIDSAGEYEHSTTLELGGIWRERGHAPRSILGVEYAANAFVEADGRWGFERLPASFDAKYEFVFDGIGSEVIGGFGLNLGTAAAVEMDATQPRELEAEGHPVALARASHASFATPRLAAGPPVAEIALTAYGNGGAVFAAGSIAWSGSLSHHGYDNNVSRITENVLRHFLHVADSVSVLAAGR